jgi:superfamily II DNA or RNA helicase
MIKLWNHQVVFKNAILKEMRKGSRHIIGSAAPAFGKSFVIASISADAIKKGNSVLLLTHRLKILSQNNGALKSFNIEPIILNDEKKNKLPNGKMYSSSAQTLKSRFFDEDVQNLLSRNDLLVLIDECHTQDCNFLLETGILDNNWVLGFTGTARRSGQQRQLGLDYDVIVETMKKSELVDSGKLPRCRYFEVPIDISKVAKNAETGDYQAKSVYKTFDDRTVYRGVIKNYKLYGEGKQFVCFCANISHAVKTCVELNKAGLKTKFVVSTVNKPNEPEDKNSAEYIRYLDHLETYNLVRDNAHLRSTPEVINDELASGEIDGITTIEVLSTGWSYDPLTVLIMARCTMSPSLWRQIGGRIERLHKDKPYGIVIDLGDNIRRLGKFDEDLIPCLWHEMSDSIGLPAQKTCGEKGIDKNGNKGCKRLILASYSICPRCGHIFKTEREEREVILVERLAQEPKKFKDMSPRALLDYAELNNYSKSWCFRQFWVRAEIERDFIDDMIAIGYKYPYIYRKIKMYKSKRRKRNERK